MKDEKVAVVTGAARGIGQAICEQLLEDGFHVVGLDISPVEWSQSPNLSSYQVNLCEAAAVSEVVDSIVAKHQRIDVLVNNAGITRDALLPDMLEQDWDSVIDVNLKAVFLLTQRVAPVMLEQGVGSIVSISSIVGTDGGRKSSQEKALKSESTVLLQVLSLPT
jgi:3-oxoacyl-[acyl-carrier protein] reductase